MLRRDDAWAQLEVTGQARGAQAELGWVLDPAYTGHGYATEAVRELLRYCFQDLGVHRVTANCFLDNDTSWRLMERVGMRRELHAVRESLHGSGRWRIGPRASVAARRVSGRAGWCMSSYPSKSQWPSPATNPLRLLHRALTRAFWRVAPPTCAAHPQRTLMPSCGRCWRLIRRRDAARPGAYDRPVDVLTLWLQRLGAAQTKQQLVDAVWDLRDLAYDHPELWTALTPLTLLQGLGEELEDAPPDDGGQTSIHVFARVFAKALDPRLE
jgi:hypothetical protein